MHLRINLKHKTGLLTVILGNLQGRTPYRPPLEVGLSYRIKIKMNPNPEPEKPTCFVPESTATESTIAQLVGEVYEAAPPSEKSRLLEQLMKPLGVLALVAIANGIFAKIRFRSSWPDLHVPLEDAQNVQASDVITLANYVQQVSVGAIDSLLDTLATSPLLTQSAAAALLMTVLLQRTKTRRASDQANTERMVLAHLASQAPTNHGPDLLQN